MLGAVVLEYEATGRPYRVVKFDFNVMAHMGHSSVFARDKDAAWSRPRSAVACIQGDYLCDLEFTFALIHVLRVPS